jgi:transcriptional regulator with XRE-family HTH domain
LLINCINWEFLTKGLRASLTLSQSQLAKQLGITRRTFGRYEEGYRQPIFQHQQDILDFITNKNLQISELELLGKTECYLFGDSPVELKQFKDQAMLFKKSLK